MANPYFLTHQEVIDQLLSYLPPSWRSGMSGKVLKRLIVAFAIAVEALYALLARMLRLAIIATSEGDWLRALVGSIGMQAFGGIPATVTVKFKRFNRLDQPLTIPLGTQVGAQFGQIFVTTQTAIMSAVTDIAVLEQAIDVPCQALEAGIGGNVRAGEIISLVTTVDGIDQVYNPNPALGGSDSEPDAQIKARVPKYIESLHRGTIPATEYAIAVDRERFPEVLGFLTQRSYGVPGYFRGILSEFTGGDLFRAKNWSAIGDLGVWFMPTTLTEINGLVSAGFPCQRFGVVSRTPNGEEQWRASNFVTDVEQGNWRFCHDTSVGRLYARADGRDLNTLEITIYSGVVWRALRELENNWAANGVHLDILVPFTVTGAIAISYALEPEYQQVEVESALRATISDFVSGLGLGEDMDLEFLYSALSAVAGASGTLVTTPTTNIPVPEDSVFRLEGLPLITRRLQ